MSLDGGSLAAAQASAANSFGRLPISFEPNRGQSDPGVDFIAHGDRSTLFLAGGDATLEISAAKPGDPPTTVGMDLIGARVVSGDAAEALSGKVNYLIGNDQTKWLRGIDTFGRVEYRGVYPGVDIAYHSSNQQQLEYDFNLAAGADASVIDLRFTGDDSLSIDAQGNLILRTGGGYVVQPLPVAYQDKAGVRQTVAVAYRLNTDGSVGFSLGDYDHDRPLVIDPKLTYSRFLGGVGTDVGFGITVDSDGAAYITGATTSSSFLDAPSTTLNHSSATTAFVAKLDPAGDKTEYVTFIGGTVLGLDQITTEGRAIAVDTDHHAFITGMTQADDFPLVSPLPGQNVFNGGTPIGRSEGTYDAFVLGLSEDGSQPIFSTYFGGGGTDVGNGIAINDEGDLAVVGGTVSHESRDTYKGFPLKFPAQPAYGGDGLLGYNRELSDVGDAFVAKIHIDKAKPDQGQPNTTYNLVYSTYLGGKGGDDAFGVAIDPKGSVYVTGYTEAPIPLSGTPFPTTPGVVQPSAGISPLSHQAAFATKYDPGGNVAYSTLIDGSGDDVGTGIAVNGDGFAFVTGYTTSYDGTGLVGIPRGGSSVPYQSKLAGPIDENGFGTADAFVVVLSPSATNILYSTYFGGSGDDKAAGIGLDGAGNFYIAGVTSSVDLPVSNAIEPVAPAGRNGFVARFHLVKAPNELVHAVLDYSTYVGGTDSEAINAIAIDSCGGVYVTGSTHSADFPVAPDDSTSSYSGTDDHNVDNLRSNTGGQTVSGGDAFVTKVPGECPSIIGLPIQTSRGQAFKGPVAVFTPQFPDDNPAHFVAKIDWGDGFVTDGDLNQTQPNGPYTITGEHTYVHPGGYVVAVRINDTYRHVNYTPTTNVSHRSGNQEEANIAIDPTNPRRMFVVSNTFGGASGIFGAYSTDGGMSWSGRNLGTGSDGLTLSFSDPQVTWDKFGNLFLVYVTDADIRDVVVAGSTDGGKSFTQLQTFSGGEVDQPSIAVGPGSVPGTGSVWISYADVSRNTILVSGAPVSAAGGIGSFNAPQAIAESTSKVAGVAPNFGSIAVGPGGQVIVNWESDGTLDSSHDRPGKGAELIVSVDPDGLGKQPFGPPNPAPNPNIAVTSLFGNRSNVSPAPNRGADAEANLVWDQSDGPHSGRVYMAYTDSLPGAPGSASIIRLVFSDDLGKSWSQPVSVDGSGGSDSLILPSIAIDPRTGDVAVGWYDTRNDPNHVKTQFFVAISTDGGQTFPYPTAVGIPQSNATDDHLNAVGKANEYGDYTGLVFENGVVHPSWTDNSFGLFGNPDYPQFDVVTAAVGEARVVEAPVTVGALPINAVENQPFSQTVALILNPDPLTPTDRYKAVINWGDGEVSEGDIPSQMNPTEPIPITGSHTYHNSLDYPVVVTVRETVTDPKTNKDTYRYSTSAVDVSRIAANQTGSVIAAVGGVTSPGYFIASNTESDVGLFVSPSFDGVTWDKASQLDPLIADKTDFLPPAGRPTRPAVAGDLTLGNTFIAYVDETGKKLVVLISTDNGKTFLSTPVAEFSGGGLGTPRIAVQDTLGGERLWVAYPDLVDGVIKVASLPILNTGQCGAPSGSVVVPGSDGAYVIGGLDVWNQGQVAVSFDSYDGTGTNAVVAVDDDGVGPDGFAPPVILGRVSESNGSPILALGGDDPGGTPSVAFSRAFLTNGALYAAYSAVNASGNREIRVFESIDFGKTWGAPIHVFTPSAGDYFGPAIAVDPIVGTVGVAWYSSESDAEHVRTQVLVSTASQGTHSFSLPQPINVGPSNAVAATGLGATSHYGGALSVSFLQSALAVTWTDNSDTLGSNPDVPEFDIAAARNYVVSVRAEPFTITANSFHSVLGKAKEYVAGTFIPGNTKLTASDFSATIFWGDGSVEEDATVVPAAVGFEIRGSHEYAEVGQYTTVISVYEHNKYVGNDRGEATVDLPISLSLSGPGPVFVDRFYTRETATVREDTFDGDASKFTGHVEWGDGSEDPVEFQADLARQAYNVVFPPHAYDKVMSGVALVVVTDKDGNIAADSYQFDAVDELLLSSRPISTVVGQTFAGHVGSLVDLDVDATASDYLTRLIDWGDGSPLDDAAVLPDPNGVGFFVDGTHTYLKPGNYTVALQVFRLDGPNGKSSAPAFVSGPKLKLGSFDLPSLAFADTVTSSSADYQITGTPGNVSDYSASIDWGDASGSSSGTVSLNGHSLTIDADHTFVGDGIYTVTLSVNGPDGATDSVVESVDVASDVSSQVAVSSPGLIFNPQSLLYAGSLTLTNTGASTITGPYIDVVLTGLPAGVVLSGAGGTTTSGDPYLVLTIDANTFAPGQSLAPMDIAFADPSNVPISYQASIYADPPPWYSSAVADLPKPDTKPTASKSFQLGFTQFKDPGRPDVFSGQSGGSSVALDAAGATITSSADGASVNMRLIGSNPAARPTPIDPQKAQVNYIVGDDAAAWKTGLSTFGQVVYRDVYPGVDLLYRQGTDGLEYDFVVAPGGDASRIAMRFDGAANVKVDPSGSLVVHTANGDVVEHAPSLYQKVGTTIPHVDGAFVLEADGSVGFKVGPHDSRLPLVIDPVIAASTFFGGRSNDQALHSAEDADGNVFIVGYSYSFDSLPLKGAIQTKSSLGFVAKFDPSGALVFATFFGGSKSTYLMGVATDAQGNAYLTGDTLSPDFPTVNPIQAKFGKPTTNFSTSGPAGFLSKLSADGSHLIYSTYLGGENADYGTSVAVDSSGNAYVTGTTSSINFPVKNALYPHLLLDHSHLNPTNDAFVVKVNPQGSDFVYSTFLGSDADDEGGSIAVDAAGNAYVSGLTEGGVNVLFPTTPGAPQRGGIGEGITFVSKLSADGSQLLFSTLLGQGDRNGATLTEGFEIPGQVASAIALDPAGNIVVLGTMRGDIAATPGAGGFVSNPHQPGDLFFDAPFLAKYSPAGQIIFVTPLAPGEIDPSVTPRGGNTIGLGLAVDGGGNAYVTGYTTSPLLPTKNPIEPSFHTNPSNYTDGFFMVVNAAGTDLVFSTYLGGTNADVAYSVSLGKTGLVHVAGETGSADFPTTDGAFQSTNAGILDAFLTTFAGITSSLKVVPVARPVTATEGAPFQAVLASFTDPRPSAKPENFKASIDWGDGRVSDGTVAVDPLTPATFVIRGAHTYAEDGTHSVTIRLTSLDDGSGTSSTRDVLVADAGIRVVAGSVSTVEGTPFDGRVGTLFDRNAFATADDFTLSIEWGDGTTSAGSVTRDSTFTGQFALSGSHLYKHQGFYPVVVSVQDRGGSRAESSAPTFSTVAVKGETHYHVVLDTTNLAGSSGVLNFQFNPGSSPGRADHATVTGLSGFSALPPGPITLTSDHVLNTNSIAGVYSSVLSFDVSLVSSGAGGSTAREFGESFALQLLDATGKQPRLTNDASGAVLRIDMGPGGLTQAYALGVGPQGTSVGGARNVLDAPLSVTASNGSTLRGRPFSGKVATVIDANPFGTASELQATIDWGNGKSGPATILANPNGGFDLLGNQTFAQAGKFNGTVTVHDVGGSVAVAAFTISVDDVSPPLTVSAVKVSAVAGRTTGSVVVATVTSGAPGATVTDFSATIAWGEARQRRP